VEQGGDLDLGDLVDLSNKDAREAEDDTHDTYADYRNKLMSTLSDWRGATPVPTASDKRGTRLQVARLRDMVPSPLKLKDRVRRMLRSADSVATEAHLMRGRFNGSDAARAVAGNLNCFQRREDEIGVNTGVCLTLDNSSSMTDPVRGMAKGARSPKLNAAKAMALHLLDACRAAGAATSALTFTEDLQGIDINATPGKWTLKTDTRTVRVLKGWNTGATEAAENIAGMDAPFGTPLAACIMAGADYLVAKRGLTRRILLALTDGDCMTNADGVRWACDYAKRRGVEVIGLVLMNGSPTALGFTHGVQVDRVEDLTGSALEALGAALAASAR
jgi:hypothetical protein